MIVREKDLERLQEFEHYGVQGMKWGVRRSTYKSKSSRSLKRGKQNIKKDNVKLANKSAKYSKKAAKYDLKASKNLAKNKINKYKSMKVKAGELNLKAQKAKQWIARNNILINLYDKRISQIEAAIPIDKKFNEADAMDVLKELGVVK